MSFEVKEITVLNHTINCIDGLFSLNDLHKASGGNKKHQPANFLRLETTKALISEIEEESLNSSDVRSLKIALKSIEGRNGGSYGCKELIYSYAMWISAKFHLTVIRVFDRQQTVQQPSVPQDLPSALRLAADLAEENNRLTHENVELEQTKMHISRHREAVAMGRLGAATKENNRLKEQLGIAETYKQVKAIPWIKDYFKTNKSGAWSQIGKALSAIERHNDVPPKYIEDQRYGKVKVYPQFVIQIFKDKLDSEKNYLAKYRKVGVSA